MDTYKTIHDVRKTYTAMVGDRPVVFNRKPSARQQLKLAEFSEQKLGPEHAPILIDVLRGMTSPETAEWLLDNTDLDELAKMMNKAGEEMADRPTTGQPDSASGLSDQTSDTGSPASASDPVREATEQALDPSLT